MATRRFDHVVRHRRRPNAIRPCRGRSPIALTRPRGVFYARGAGFAAFWDFQLYHKPTMVEVGADGRWCGEGEGVWDPPTGWTRASKVGARGHRVSRGVVERKALY